MKISCVGAGPAGLYLAILMKSRDASHEVTVYEQNPKGVTHGWGVVYWDDLIADLQKNDPVSARRILDRSFRWVDQVVDVNGRRATRAGNSGYSMRRQQLLDILSERAVELGVDIRYETEIDPGETFADSDVVVAADGVGSRLRRRHEGSYGTTLTPGRNKYVWLGTTRVFHSFTFGFVETEVGWIWFHAYGFDQGTSTLIVECAPETWAGLGFNGLGAEASLRRLETLFADQLDGHPLMAQVRDDKLPWLHFSRLTNAAWHKGKVVLVGDSAHTTHFSIGSGTRLAVQDSISLARHLEQAPDVPTALQAYETERKNALRVTQQEAYRSLKWYENFVRYARLDPARMMTVMLNRRSVLVSVLPPRIYCWLEALSDKVTFVGRARSLAGDLYRRVPRSL